MALKTMRTHGILQTQAGLLVGIGLDNAVLDVLTNADRLRACVELLRQPHRGLVSTCMGTFGIYPVTLNVHHDDSVSIFVDGPYLSASQNQATGMYLDKEAVRTLLNQALEGPHA